MYGGGQFSLDLFHSRLGNQQFNHYPMKLPPSGCCTFIDNVHDAYGQHLTAVVNLPAKGECPISPRSIHIIDYALPQNVVPPVVPRGLWKALVTGKNNGQVVISYYFLARYTKFTESVSTGLTLMFENVEQLSGFEEVLCDFVRIRKYNRSTTVLNGMIILSHWLNGTGVWKQSRESANNMLRVFLYVVSIISATGLKVVFENFVQLAGFNDTLYDLHVRKYNRTTTVLNGTVVITYLVNDSTVFSLDLFHSRLGNQQFNHYPMKLPSSGCCTFFDNLQIGYGEHIAEVKNLPAIGECPISPRTIHVFNFTFPQGVVPTVMPRGLWKALLTGRRAGKVIFFCAGIKMTFENLEQLSGFEELLCDVHIRKYNRSTTVLNGSFILRHWFDDTTVFSLDLFHSRLGNQQFNHYPMKLPSGGTCSFINNLRSSYGQYMAGITNLPGIEECPISARTIDMLNFAFPQGAVPPVLPRGLWKAQVTARRDEKLVLAYYFLIRAFDDCFEQTLGEDKMWLDLRVRKYNRTSTVINGTVYVKVEGTNDYRVSRLGNQQFNHLPMKLPTAGVCDFFTNLHENYPEQMKRLSNVPPKGECPISVREIYAIDQEFPLEVLPKGVVRDGLYKALATLAALWLIAVGCRFQLCGGNKIYFESFEQTHGEDWMWCDLRVRKFNRTSTVINGTIHVLRESNNDFVFHVDLFYSRLGNQQFNHYPARLPTAGICDFVDNLYVAYPSVAKLITNLPAKDECPISVREMHMFDQEIPQDIVPRRFVQQDMLALVLVAGLCLSQTFALRGVFDSFEQTLGKELFWCDLRVRKLNRTTAVLNGTMHLYPASEGQLSWALSSFLDQFSLDLFHSRLGNQQFNHYPMKLPTRSSCEFIDNMHDQFPQHIHLFENLPDKHECPIGLRHIHIRDMTFPSDALPPVMPAGLWKALMRGWVNGTEQVSYYVVWKLLDWF
uniref:Uncharacterized protein n=1 Tax=Anopheles dirus TaxID=7168 RepID=A0A182NQB0_9DIPT